jgi:hypothetical protein
MPQEVTEARIKSSVENTNSLRFNAVTATPRVTIPNHASLQGLTAFTIEALVNMVSLPGFLSRICEYSATNKGLSLWVETTGAVSLKVGNGTSEATVTSTRKLDFGSFSQVAATWNGAVLKVAINGKFTEAAPVSLAGGNTQNPGTDIIIGNRVGADRAFVGLIQEVRISNNVRYVADYVPSKSQFEYDENTLLLMHMDEGEGETITSSTPVAHVGTLVGTTLPLWSGGVLWKDGNTQRAAAV